MEEIVAKLRQFWAARSLRERNALLAGGAALGLLLLYLILIEPAASGVARLHRMLPQARSQAVQLEAVLAESKSLRKLAPAATSAIGDVRALVDSSVESAGLKAAHGATQAAGELRLRFVEAPYARWAIWLASAERTLGVHAVAVQARAGATAGNADIDLTLRLPRP